MIMEHPVKHTLDAAAVMATLGTLANILPVIAAILSILWTAMRITEMITGKAISELLKRNTHE